ncbi:MAG TPA: DUF4332 domain-containing protein [bacterium]|nr:DUF4332 domain-containing protein [bacterium]
MKSKRISVGLLNPWWWIPGIWIMLLGVYSLIFDVPKLNILWYVFGWYGYLLILDAVIYYNQQDSFLTSRRRELLEMLFWSVPFWFLFEAYNFVIQNWYYVYAFKSDWQQGVFAWFSFATVLPACFFHAELLKSCNVFTNIRARPIKVHKGLKQFFLYFGALCISLPLIFPRYTFWMIWGATLGVPDVINYYNGAPSILRDLERGRPGRLYRLLVGGMIAGLVWEGLNYWARCKWIYTVPGLEEAKLFEMPIPGFLGFPILAVEAFAFYSLLSHYLRGSRHWELRDREQLEKKASAAAPFAGLIAMGVSVVIFTGVLNITLQSRRPLLQEFDNVTVSEVQSFASRDIHTPEQLYDAVQHASVESVAARTGVEAGLISQIWNQTSLALHKGMGVENAALLQSVGIEQVTDLIGADAGILHQKLSVYATKSGQPAPRSAEVKVWIRAVELSGGTKR